MALTLRRNLNRKLTKDELDDNFVYLDNKLSIPGPQGSRGPEGPAGQGFKIAKIYTSLAALTADHSPSNINQGEFALISASSAQDPNNNKLYIWTGTAYSYITNLSNSQSIRGPQGSQDRKSTRLNSSHT